MMEYNKLVYLISTKDEGIDLVLKSIPKENSNKIFVICHQVSNTSFIKSEIDRSDIIYIESRVLGLSKSRNILLEYFFNNYKKSIFVLTDDDVIYQDVDVSDIYDEFVTKKADILISRVWSFEQWFKDYESRPLVHDLKSVRSVSSIEIIGNGASFTNSDKTILFNERFGLGAKYKLGEEPIFLTKIIENGYRILSTDLSLFVHPKESSGTIIVKEFYYAKSGYYVYFYGKVIGSLLLCRLILKHHFSGKSKCSLLDALKCAYKGVLDY
ncbi:hypothetical protein [Vibrio rumoiensis]|uniref:hypothetical protein n=1 Tax=Vibrio rumoiensis TaxID=76258 RepID=UPI000B5C9176|nr:hypothetical protein [Vibrio rumoiensis]